MAKAIKVHKQWLLDQIAWNEKVTQWLLVVMPRDPKGDLIPSMDSPDYLKYMEGMKLTEQAKQLLLNAQANKERRVQDDTWLFEDQERRA
jgi:hypothetical protein